MDKSAIRNFAIEARNILMKSAVSEAGLYGISKNGCSKPVQKGEDFEIYETIAGTQNRIFGAAIKRRANLVQAIEQLGFEQVIEETAYTWFNRIIAIRFMEVNNYLPSRVRVLSSETGSSTPDIVAQSDTVDLNMTEEELQKVREAKNNNKYDEAFRLLFVKQCNELNAILPGLFEKTNDYMELLLKLSYTGDGVVRMLVDTIPEDNFNVETEGQVEIIGWMYQYYNTELKDDTFGKLKNKVKISKERIPAATQLFTPDWIVRYMVENSVGRVWIEHLRANVTALEATDIAKQFKWDFYLDDEKQDGEVINDLVKITGNYSELKPEEIKCIDPCMGSGHVLVYMFDVLMDIYRSEGYNDRDSVFSILENNICGIDIDRRAYQLSYFALMMKARSYNRLFFRGIEDENGVRRVISPKVCFIEESNDVNRKHLEYFGESLNEIEKNNALNQITGLLDDLKDAREYGSIIHVNSYNWDLLYEFINNINIEGQLSFDTIGIEITQKKIMQLLMMSQMLAGEYWAVVTNPPYMVLSNANSKLNSYVKSNYPASKADMFAVFIERCYALLKPFGIESMITMHSWMFIGSFEELRKRVLKEEIISLLHLGIKAFEEIGNDVVQTCAFTIRKSPLCSRTCSFEKLDDYKNYLQKKEAFLSKRSFFYKRYDRFTRIPGYVFAYWVSDEFITNFEKGSRIENYATFTGSQNITGDNETYLRYFWEISAEQIGNRWRFYAKGGDYRQYYGNLQMVIDWSELARAFYKNNKTSNLLAEELWYKEGITYSAITSRGTGFRYLPEGCIFDKGGPSINVNNRLYEILALLNSAVAKYYFGVFNPSINLQVKDIKNFPIILPENREVEELSHRNVEIAANDWNSSETAFGFMKYPINGHGKISELYNNWKEKRLCDFEELRENEERINEIFIKLYNLQDELSNQVEEREISVRKPDLNNDMRALLSYIVGCVMGRYSLDEDGIICANCKLEIEKYKTFIPDMHGIIPITDSEYFDNDIVSYVIKFVETAFGSEYLDENINFICKAIGGRGNTPREILQNYFLDSFFKDHCNMYSVTGSGKRPIYWLFDSGKENGFKCLIYVHRYSKDTVGIIRTDYLSKVQNAIENAQKNAEYVIQTSASAVDRAQATKQRDKYIKQLAELRTYYQALSHVAQQRIELDLDDGVKVNYAKFQGIEVSIDGEKKQTIDLLAKI